MTPNDTTTSRTAATAKRLTLTYLRQGSGLAPTAEQIAERMISREYRCTVCNVGTLKPGEEMCRMCVETADEYAAEWDDILSGRDLHNTCLACGCDAHNNAICSDCTAFPRMCSVRGCGEVAVEGETRCSKCRDEVAALEEPRNQRRGITWADLVLLSFLFGFGLAVAYGLAIRWGWAQ